MAKGKVVLTVKRKRGRPPGSKNKEDANRGKSDVHLALREIAARLEDLARLLKTVTTGVP